MKQIFFYIIITALLLAGCRATPSDEKLQAGAEKMIANKLVTVEVKEAVATLTGTVADTATKTAAEAATRSVEGVTGVTNAIVVAEPPPAPASIAVSSDTILDSLLSAALQNYPGVKGDVNHGIITLTGKTHHDSLAGLMQSVMALRPASIENKMTVQ